VLRLLRTYAHGMTKHDCCCCNCCRVATTGLLALLCTTYPDFHIVFIALIALDIFSHWFQMYQTLLAGSSTHKVGLMEVRGGGGLRGGVVCASCICQSSSS
jgi:hypothetical protein